MRAPTIIILALAGLSVPALAHDWYSGLYNPVTRYRCCDEKRDCNPISIERVVETRDHFVIDGRFKFPKDQAMPSPDGQYHACIIGDESSRNSSMSCFFYPVNT